MNWTEILVALIAGGLLTVARDAYKAFRFRRVQQLPEARQALTISTVDQSLAVVAKARDELEADNERLRRQQAEDHARYEADRARWELRESAMRAEIDALEQKLRDLLREVENMKDRHAFDEIEQRRGLFLPPS